MRTARTSLVTAAIALGVAFLPGRALAQAGPGGFDSPPPAPSSSFQTEYLRQLDAAEKKLSSLAEALPADKYGWRPGAGVRSIGEVVGHVAAANWLFISFVGVKPPAGTDPSGFEKIADKAKLIAVLKDSFAAARRAAASAGAADFDTMVKMFGRDASVREVYLTSATHLHEHLGQLIAYARSVGVTPPWSEKPAPAKKPS